MVSKTISAHQNIRLLTSLTIGLLSIFISEAAKAVSINFTTSSSPLQTFFSDTNSAVDVNFEGTEPPGTDTIDITEGIPLNGVFINLLRVTTRDRASGISETKPIGYTFTINNPVISEPASVAVTYDLAVSVSDSITSPVTLSYNLISPPTTTFNLGAQGFLDVTFLTPSPGGFPANNEGSNGQFVSANFLLRPVPEPSSTLGILAFFALGAVSVLKRKRNYRDS